MTVVLTANDRKTGPLIASAGQRTFDTDFPLLAGDDIRVERVRGGVKTVLAPAAYTVSNVGVQGGARVTLAVGANLADAYTLIGARVPVRTAQFAADAFRSADVNAELDSLVAVAQEQVRAMADLAAETSAALEAAATPSADIIAAATAASNAAAAAAATLVQVQAAIAGSGVERRPINVRNYIPANQHAAIDAGTSTYDCSAHFAAALADQAAAPLAYRRAVYVPAGRYIIGAKIVLPNRSVLFGDGFGTHLISTISNGDAVIELPAGAAWWKLADLMIDGDVDFASFLAGTVAARDCIGIKGVGFATRGLVSNVRVDNCKVGIDINGFIFSTSNVWVNACETGFIGTNFNAATLDIHIENCRKAYALSGCNALVLTAPMVEGGNASANAAATIDDCHGVKFLCPYLEWAGDRAVPFVHIGPVTACSDVTFEGGSYAGPVAAGVHLIEATYCNGLDISGTFSTGARNTSFKIAPTVTNYRCTAIPRLVTGLIQDDSRQLGGGYNYFANSDFSAGLKGWPKLEKVGATATIETAAAYIRKGARSLKVGCVAGQSFNHLAFQFDGQWVTRMRGRRVRAAAWIYVPDLARYDEAGTAGVNRCTPLLHFYSWNGSTVIEASSGAVGFKRGAWNFAVGPTEVELHADAIRFDVNVYANDTGLAAVGDEAIWVDQLMIVDADIPIRRLINETIPDSPLIDAHFIGGMMIDSGTAAPSDVDQIFDRGDRRLHLQPSAAGFEGWVCTAGGSPGTWKQFGTVAA